MKKNNRSSSSTTTGHESTKIIQLFANSKVNYLLSVLEATPGNIYWKNAQNKFQGTNWEMAEILGLSHPRDIIGKSNRELFDPKLAKLADAIDHKVLKSKKTILTEEIGLNKDGARVIYLSIKKPLLDEEGNVIGLVGNSIDISKIKEAEEREKEAEEQKKEAELLRREFIGNMEHDLRTPISGIYSALDVLVAEETEPDKKYLLEISRNASKELLDIINKILDFKNQENDVISIQERKFNLHNVIERVVSLEMPVILQKKLNFTFNYDKDCPIEILSDEDRLRSIIFHILTNAIKFTEQGSIEIDVKNVKKTNKRKALISISVKDTGKGIAEKHKNIIFEKFKKLTPSNTGKEKGMGIGLYIVKQFVNDLEGDIYLESEPNKGTNFTFVIEAKLPLI